MKLLKCHAENFGTLSSFDYDFTSGLNVINKPNGWGKTTFANFLKAMFYGLKKNGKHSLDENVRKRYEPWNGGNYGGYVDFEVNGNAYRIERYLKDKESEDTFTLINLATNKPSSDYSSNIGEELFGLDADAFERTAFIPQKALDTSINESIENKLNALLHGTNDESNYEDALSRLKNTQSKLKNTHKTGIIDNINKQILDLESELAKNKIALNGTGALKEEIAVKDLEISKINQDKKVVEDEIKRYAEIKEKQLKLEAYKKLEQGVEDIKREIAKLNACFNDTELTHAEIDDMRASFDKVQSIYAVIDSKENDYIEHKYETLKEYFRNGVPTRNDMLSCANKINEINSLKNIKAEAENNAVQKQSVKLPLILAGVGVALIIGGALTTKILALCIVLFVLGGLALLGGGFKYLIDMINYKTQIASVKQFTSSQSERLLIATSEVNAFLGLYEQSSADYQTSLNKIMTSVETFESLSKEHQKHEVELNALRNEMHDYKDRVDEFLSRYSIPNNLSYPERFNHLKQLRYNLDGKRKELEEKTVELKNAKKYLEENGITENLATFDISLLQEKQRLLQAQINKIENEKGVISQRIKGLEELAGKIDEQETGLENLNGELDKYLLKLKHVSNAIKFLEKANDELIARFLSPMKTQLVKYYKALTGKDGENLFLSTKFSVTFEELGRQREIGYYSKGYKTALALAMRFALIATLFGSEKPYVVLDDPFVDLDEKKLTSAFDCLKELQNEYQIIYFTCHDSRVKS